MFRWDQDSSSQRVEFKDNLQKVTSSSTLPAASLYGSSIDSDHSFSDDVDEEFMNEYMRPVTVTVSDGNAFKTVIGDDAMTPGGRYFFEVQINAGYLIKIGICRNSVDSEQVSVLTRFDPLSSSKSFINVLVNL